MKQIFKKQIFYCFSCLMVPKKMVQIYFSVFLTNWLDIFLLVLEQSLRSSYIYSVYLVDLLACLTKDQQASCLTKGQQSSIDICAKTTPRRYKFKAWIPEGSQSCLFDGTGFFPLLYNYTSQEDLMCLLLNISQANSMEPQIPNKLDPGAWPRCLNHENDPQVWPTRMTLQTHTI